MTRTMRGLWLGALSLGLVGCGMFPALVSSTTPVQARRTGANWTILVHMAVDNDLYTPDLADLNELETGLGNAGVQVLVLFDGPDRGDSAIYRVRPDAKFNSTVVSERLPESAAVLGGDEIDGGDPALVARFVSWAARTYPAEHTMLDLWSPGNGPYFMGAGNALFRGFVVDLTHQGYDPTFLKQADLSRTILPAYRAATGRNLDLLAFDSCLTGYAEIAAQATQADYMVASQDTEPADGHDYVAWLRALSKKPTMSPLELGTAISRSYVDSYRTDGSQAPSRPWDVTMSVVDLQAFRSQLQPALQAYAETGLRELSLARGSMAAVRDRAKSFYQYDTIDLKHYLGLVQQEPGLSTGLKASARNLQGALDQTVRYSASSPGVGAGGLSAYFPNPKTYFDPRYLEPGVGLGDAWSRFLQAQMEPRSR